MKPALIIAVLPMFAAYQPASAQADICAASNVTVVRVSKIKPGAMDAFRKAVADHTKWYADHGYPDDRQLIAPVLVTDPATGRVTQSPHQAMTLHTHASAVPPAKQDAAWAAYVAEYRASSDLVSTTLVCLPM